MITASWLDYIVIVLYFVGILYIGTLFSRFTKSTSDFFFGGQRFAWWLVAISCIATVVGSYSFIKYAAIGYQNGLSSTMTYLNDWFIVPFFLLGWLPIIYFNRIKSIPEYFERRFDTKTRLLTVFFILLFMTGYVGINFYTLGTALQPMLNLPAMGVPAGWDLYIIVVLVAIVGAIYMHAGGQTSVIMTDLLQGFVLLGAGFLVFILGLSMLGGIDVFFANLPVEHRLPFTKVNLPTEFSHAGIFWQDAAASSIAFYFMNQGTIMRFLSTKSPRDGRKAMFAIILIFMPLAVLAIANTGWLGTAMVNTGLLDNEGIREQLLQAGMIKPDETDISKHIFMVVTDRVTQWFGIPGVFGFIVAALTAALMSTIDTLVNAITAIFINDVYQPYIKPDQEDHHYLNVARIVAIAAAVVGILLVPFFASYRSIYVVHGMFTATITPPLVTIILLSIFSRRITTPAAFWSLILGFAFTLIVSLISEHNVHLIETAAKEGVQPQLWFNPMEFIAHGIGPENGYRFIRALFGIGVTVLLALLISMFTKPKSHDEMSGLVIASIKDAKLRFKGAEPNEEEIGEKVHCHLKLSENLDGVGLSQADLDRMAARVGDLIYLADERWWLGGLKSLHARVTHIHDQPGEVRIAPETLEDGHLSAERGVVAEKII
ncbi:MAG: sodium/solute symporter [Leptospiraceae bacterium]|nr:sodium/solute symporter [Leptospiraceae bacterium]